MLWALQPRMGNLVGAVYTDDILDRIFNCCCTGKKITTMINGDAASAGPA